MNSIYEQNGGTYTQAGDYLFPNLVMDPSRRVRSAYGVGGARCTLRSTARAPTMPC